MANLDNHYLFYNTLFVLIFWYTLFVLIFLYTLFVLIFWKLCVSREEILNTFKISFVSQQFCVDYFFLIYKSLTKVKKYQYKKCIPEY